MTGIYKITSPNKKIYIGQSVNIKKRWNQYQTIQKTGIGRHIYNSLKKYGPENHTFEIIEECSLEQLNEREIYWINFYNSLNEGLNLTDGGSNGKHTEETKDIIRLKATGRKLSVEAKQKISQSKMGNKYNLGRIHSEEVKQSPQYKNRKKGRITPERNSKIKEKLQKPIIQYDLKMNFIKEWPSQTEASQVLNINQPSISNCLKNLSKTSKGFIWKFKN
jgi:group I intron endonuclease